MLIYLTTSAPSVAPFYLRLRCMAYIFEKAE